MTRFGLVVAAALLAVDPWGWDRFGPLRWALLSTIGFAAIAISLGAGDARLRPLPRWSVLGWILTIVGLTVSTALSNDRLHALIGTPDRHLGLATWILFGGLFATASLYPKTAVHGVIRATAVATSLSGLWAVLEWRGAGPFDSSFADDRVGGPLGQPAFLGAAMTLGVPICAAAATRRSPRLWRLLAAAGTVLGTFALVVSESRAAWIAAVFAGSLVVVRRRLWLVGFVATIALVSLAVMTDVGDRALTLTEVDTGVVAGRLDEWAVGSRALIDTSTFGVFGHGPEGYRTVFGVHVDEEYVIRHGREVITDRAHNGLLDTSLAGGLVAGIGMVLLQVGLGVTALQRMRADDPIDVGLAAAVGAYLVQQFFLFPLAELDPVLWIFAGLLVARRPHGPSHPPPLFSSVSSAKRAAMLAAGLVAAVSGIAGLSDVAADRAIDDVADAGETDVQALAAADTARDRRPDSIRYDFIAARVAARTGTLDGFRNALERLDHGLSTSPRDPALLEERGIILLEIARRDPDRSSLDEALTALEALDEADPRNPATELTHGIALALAGRPDEAIAELEHAARLSPGAVEPVLNLALVHFEGGDTEAGRAALDEVDRIAPGNATAQSLRREFLSE